jgi:hypothetical protein
MRSIAAPNRKPMESCTVLAASTKTIAATMRTRSFGASAARDRQEAPHVRVGVGRFGRRRCGRVHRCEMAARPGCKARAARHIAAMS